MLRTAIPVMLALSPAMALAQGGSSMPIGTLPGDLPGAAEEAVSALSDAAQDRLLIKDVIGSTVSAPGGGEVGTVDDLVAIPGGRIVAAIVTLKDGGDTIVVPFAALKLASAGETAGIVLPATVSELRSNPAVQKLADAIGSTGSQ